MDSSTNLSIIVSSARLFVISSLLLLNGGAIWKVVSHPKVTGSRQINKLAVTCMLVINVVYLSLVWAPFTMGALKHDIIHYGHQNNSQLNEPNLTATVEEIPIPILIKQALPRQRRWAKIETPQEHKGTWAIVFPVAREPEISHFREPLPIFLNVDCGFQDCITSSCCYSLAFIAIIKLILTRKPLSLPTSGLALTGYTSLLTGVPLLATLAIRYTEQVGSSFSDQPGMTFSPHEPKTSSTGYTVYNIICDIQVSDSFVFQSFLEWSGLMMVLLLTVTSFLGISSKVDLSHRYSNHLTSSHKLSFIEKVSYKGGQYTRDTILGLGALWSWPTKPCVILLTYVIYGKHWSNSITWISHTVVTTSVIFVALATFICNGTFADDQYEDKINSSINSSNISTSSSKKSKGTKTFSKVMGVSSNFLAAVHSREERPPSYEEYTKKYFPQINEEEQRISTHAVAATGEKEVKIVSKCAQDIKNKLRQLSEPSDRKFVLNLTNKKPEDTKIILKDTEDSPASFSEV